MLLQINGSIELFKCLICHILKIENIISLYQKGECFRSFIPKFTTFKSDKQLKRDFKI